MKNDEQAFIEWHFIVKAQLPLLNAADDDKSSVELTTS